MHFFRCCPTYLLVGANLFCCFVGLSLACWFVLVSCQCGLHLVNVYPFLLSFTRGSVPSSVSPKLSAYPILGISRFYFIAFILKKNAYFQWTSQNNFKCKNFVWEVIYNEQYIINFLVINSIFELSQKVNICVPI